jgi:hypothetical protein
MQCPTCGAMARLDDNFCPVCGVTLRAQRLPVVREQTYLVPSRWLTSGLLRQALVLAAGAMLPVLARSVARAALRSAAVERINPVAAKSTGILRRHEGAGPIQIETHSIVELHTIRDIRFPR